MKTDNDSGIGVIKLINDAGEILMKGNPRYKQNFNIVLQNKSLIPFDYIKNNDLQSTRYRGVLSFRSDSPDVLTSQSLYWIKTNAMGLRKGKSQNFYFQSILGSHSYYDLQDLQTNHNSNNTFIEILTSSQVSSSSDFSDAQASVNCDIYSSKYATWNSQITKTIAQQTLPFGVFIQIEPDNYNFIGGCSVKTVTEGPNTFTRMRIRLQDKYFVDNQGLGRFLKGVDFFFLKESDLNSSAKGGIFLWKNVDVNDFSQPFAQNGPVLDAFLRVFFQAETSLTDRAIEKVPDIQVMENLHVFSKEVFDKTKVFPSIKNQFIYKDSTGLYLENKDSVLSTVFLLQGTIDNLDAVKNLLIQIDFAEGVQRQIDSFQMQCSAKGSIQLGSCKLLSGLGETE